MGLLSSIFGGSDSHQTNTTSSTNSSDTYSTVDSHNVATNTTNNSSSNSTVNDTNTLTQDRRLVTDHGIGVSADNSTVWTVGSGNNTTTTNDTQNFYSTDQGAVAAGLSLGLSSIESNRALALRTVDVSQALTASGASMMKANLDFLAHVGDSTEAQARDAIREVATASSNALNQVVGIASKPLNANDPQRLVIIVALGVIGIVFLSKMKA